MNAQGSRFLRQDMLSTRMAGRFHALLLAVVSSVVLFGASNGAATAAETFPATVYLADLDGSDGFRLDSEAEGDRSGFSVSQAGDINGDGFDDVIVGAPGADPNGGESGRSYVIFGRSTGFPPLLQLSSVDGSNGFMLNGESGNDSAGVSVSRAGDVNGDGWDDLIIGAEDYSSHSGRSYVLFGRGSGFPAIVQLSSLRGVTGFKLGGESSFDFSGNSVSSAGDMNGDGLSDVIIGARGVDANGGGSGRSYVVFGRSSGFPELVQLSTLDGSNGFAIDGETSSDFSGFSVSRAGDINADGLDDVIIGAFQAADYAGRAYVVFGRASGFPTNVQLADLDGSDGFKLESEVAGARTGYAVGFAGDLNADGVDDVVVSAPYAQPNGPGSARYYVVFGRSTGFAATEYLADINGINGIKLDGEYGSYSYSSVSQAGDVNGDGMDDLIIGHYAPRKSCVVYGRSNGFPATIELTNLDGIAGFKLEAYESGTGSDAYGYSVSHAGDLNGDGVDDLILGAPNRNSGHFDSSFVVFGRNSGLIFRNGFEQN